MARIRTQNDFIEKAREIHDGKYDYSLVEYHKSDERVKIVCPIHGVFEQTPNKHLAGQGCKFCGRERTKLGFDEFVERSRKVHGDKYDYAKVVYSRIDEKVCIICPEHGEFWQTPHSHIILKQNCPKCAAAEGGSKRKGDNNCMRKDSVKMKARQTCLERYGTKTYAESDEGRKKLHDVIVQPELQERTKQTCQERYGADNWTQSIEGHQVLHNLMSSDEMKDRVRQGYLDAYGTDHYMKTDEGKGKVRASMLDSEHQMKARHGLFDKYGVYAAVHIPGVLDKSWATKRKNGTFNTSDPENTLRLLLYDVFGKDDVLAQYRSDPRYPFTCDFYVKSIDTFIELNANWTHGGHWFSFNNLDDIEMLNVWKRRAAEKGSRYYIGAIDTWTRRDLLKRDTAIKNHLNYVVFWDNNLADARAWLEQYRK